MRRIYMINESKAFPSARYMCFMLGVGRYSNTNGQS